MTRRLILVKHSLPELKPGIPANQWQLSTTGKQRCTKLAHKLSPYLPFKLFSSVEPKAAQTAALVANQLQIAWSTFPGLHEHERPEAVLLSNEEFHARIRQCLDQPSEIVFGGESADQASQRFSTAIQALFSGHASPQENLVIVAHGTVISLFVARTYRIPVYPLWKLLGLPSFIALDLPIELDEHRDGWHPIEIFNPYHPGAPV